MSHSKDIAGKSLQGKNQQNLIAKIISFFFSISKHDSKDPGFSFWENSRSLILFVCVLFYQIFMLPDILFGCKNVFKRCCFFCEMALYLTNVVCKTY